MNLNFRQRQELSAINTKLERLNKEVNRLERQKKHLEEKITSTDELEPLDKLGIGRSVKDD